MKKSKSNFSRFILLVFLMGFFLIGSVSAAPEGAGVTSLSNSSAPGQAAGSQAAIAGNVTDLDISGYSSTQAWQGYYGNVTGTIQLADGSSNVLYNWSDASPSGEVYSSTNSTISWLNVQCFNFTATGEINPTGETPGATNLKGMNLTQLHDMFGINISSDYDTVNATFPLIGSPTDHSTFYTANLQFDGAECQTTRVFDDTGQGVQGKFEQVIQYEPTTDSVIWTSLLNQDATGFDGKTHDFEMVVPENGHGTDTATTTYYFYVELQ